MSVAYAVWSSTRIAQKLPDGHPCPHPPFKIIQFVPTLPACLQGRGLQEELRQLQQEVQLLDQELALASQRVQAAGEAARAARIASAQLYQQVVRHRGACVGRFWGWE